MSIINPRNVRCQQWSSQPGSLVSFLDSIIWANSNAREWWDGKIYCDITSRIKSAVPIGIPGAAIGLCRFLADTTAQHVSQQEVHKFKNNLIDLFFGIFLPLINTALKLIVTPSRYVISGVNGYTGITDDSRPAILLYYLWSPLLCFVAAGYAGIASYVHC